MLIEMNVTTWDDVLLYLKDMEIMLRITQNHCFNVYTQNHLMNWLENDIYTVIQY